VGSPLAEEIGSAADSIRRFDRFAKSHAGALRSGNDKVADELWQLVLDRVNQVITKAELLHGGRINPHRW